MSTRKLDLEIGHVKEGTAKLLSITSSKFEDDWISSPHTHCFTEIFYIKSGEGHMQIENSVISISSNHLIIINAHVQHTEISSPASPLDYFVLGAEGLQITSDDSRDYSLIHCPDSNPSIRQCFENILSEMKHKNDGYKVICQNYLEILVLQLCRKDSISYDIVETQKSTRECHKVKQYIDENYQDKITLEHLSNISNLNKYYLSHKFTEMYGKSPIAYLNQVRITACKDLLRTTNHSIEEIAHMTGFSSRSYFAQAFNKICFMTAQQYRKAYKNM